MRSYPKTPAYEQVKKYVLDLIRQNGLRPGDKLPAECEIRRLLGWSRLTVIRALDELEIEGTIDRVKGSGNYVSHPSRHGRPPKILIASPPPSEHLGDSYLGRMFTGIGAAAAAGGISIIYHAEDRKPLTAGKVRGLKADGVLLMTLDLDGFEPALRMLEEGIPLIAVASRNRALPVPCVSSDNHGSLKLAVERLASLGHRRIAYLSHGLGTCDVQERVIGYQDGLQTAGLPFDPAIMLVARKSPAPAALRSWFGSLGDKPTAMILSQDLVFPVMNLLAGTGLTVPKDVSIVSTDDDRSFASMSPSISAIRQPVAEIGRTAVARLAEMIAAGVSKTDIVVPSELVLRDSVASVPGMAAHKPMKKST